MASCKHNWMMGSALVVRPPCPYCAGESPPVMTSDEMRDVCRRLLESRSRGRAIAFLRSLKAGNEGATIYQDVIDHVLAALDEARTERSLVVTWLRRQRPEGSGAWDYAAAIERGDHAQESTGLFPGATCGSPCHWAPACGRDVICACGHRAWLHAGDKDECLACTCRAFQ